MTFNASSPDATICVPFRRLGDSLQEGELMARARPFAAIREQSKQSWYGRPFVARQPTIKPEAESAAEVLWWSMMDPMFLTKRERLEDLMRATRPPVANGFREYVVAGGLLSYASDLARDYRCAVTYVDKILKTAKALGLNIPQPMLPRSDEVIQ
jgi:hypothetical protein